MLGWIGVAVHVHRRGSGTVKLLPLPKIGMSCCRVLNPVVISVPTLVQYCVTWNDLLRKQLWLVRMA